MIHVSDSGVCRLSGIAQIFKRSHKTAFVLFAAAALFMTMSKPASAQPFSTGMSTLASAIGGNGAALGVIQSDTNLMCYDSGMGTYTIPCAQQIVDEVAASLAAGVIATFSDRDGDGIKDLFDHDLDGDGIPNLTDPDIDNDGTLNAADNDDDQNGQPDGSDTDTDGDGWIDTLDPNDDNDGFADTTDSDRNGNGVLDVVEYSTSILGAADGGDINALNLVHARLGGAHFNSGGWPDWDPFMSPSSWSVVNDMINTAIAGTGTTGLIVMRQAFSGNPTSRMVVNFLLDGGITGNLPNSTVGFIPLFRAGLPTPDLPSTLAVLDDAISGDAQAINRIRVAINDIVTYNGFYFDPTARAYLQGLLISFGGAPSMIDTDGDGIPDSTDPDIDGDGIANTNDTDDDGDGIPDNEEMDTDGDGITDDIDTDDDGDGDPDTSDPDDDDDGIPDYQDPDIDTDGDGDPDVTDTDDDGDGDPDTTDPDDDGDGIDDLNDNDSAVNNTDDPTATCGDATADLTGTFAVDPCLWTRDERNLTYAQNYEGGEQFATYLLGWWRTEFQPTMREMMAQIHAGVIDQTRNIGSAMNAVNMTKSIRSQQANEFESKKNLMPNELTCVAGTHAAAIATTNTVANSLTEGFKTDMSKRSGGAPTEPSNKGTASDVKDRLDKYCQFFLNPDANNGINVCPNPTTAGALVDGDIDIESFLFKDSIDFNVQANREAAEALMANLVRPTVYPRLTDQMINSARGRETILQREYMESIRTIMTDVLSSMLSRRVSVPLPTTAGGTSPPPAAIPVPGPPPLPPPPGSGTNTYDDFLNALGRMESGGAGCNNHGGSAGGGGYKCVNSIRYLGKYQFGEYALIDVGCIQNVPPVGDQNISTYVWRSPCGGVSGITSYMDFLNSPAAQEAAIRTYMGMQRGYIGAVWTSAVCTTIGGILMSPSAMLAGAHLVGHAAMKAYINSGGTDIRRDGNGTPITKYLAMFGGYNTPYGGDCGSQPGQGTGPTAPPSSPPPAPKPVAMSLKEIRECAGVPPADISPNPSYNEIMLAMTKERFFCPKYFIGLNNNIGALKQEQTSINAYIAIILVDIEAMQERINLLLAAKASLKYNEEAEPTMRNFTPVK